MQPVIISDASCLILLAKIDKVEVLHKLFGKIVTTQAVADEFGRPLPEWVNIRNPKSDINFIALQDTLGKGESSAIALSLELDESILIIDELRGRRIAKQLGLTITGTLGVIAQAKIAGVIPSVIPIIEKIKQTDFYITNELEQVILKMAEEL